MGASLQHMAQDNKPLTHHDNRLNHEQVENPSGPPQHVWAPCQPWCWHLLMPGDMGSGAEAVTMQTMSASAHLWLEASPSLDKLTASKGSKAAVQEQLRELGLFDLGNRKAEGRIFHTLQQRDI